MIAVSWRTICIHISHHLSGASSIQNTLGCIYSDDLMIKKDKKSEKESR